LSGKGNFLSLENFLIVSAIIFSIGMYGALSKKNAITVLMSLELMFNAVNISAVALSRYGIPAGLATNPQAASDDVVQFVLTGQIFSIFIIAVAAAEVALGLAIVISVYRNKGSIFVTDAAEMKN